eukprot:g79670.t1
MNLQVWSTADPSMKILISGDVCGYFASLVQRVDKLHKKKGPFEGVFCVGNFLAPGGEAQLADYLSGAKKLPVPFYFILGDEQTAHPLLNTKPEGVELCKNLTYLGRAGVKELLGLRVAFLSGGYDPVMFRDTDRVAAFEKYRPFYVEADVQSLQQQAGSAPVDVLLTAEWGAGFHHLLSAEALPKTLPNPPQKTGSPVVASLASSFCSRYHFAGLEDTFFTLPPYSTNVPGYCCRFYGLGKTNSKRKIKSLYAINITPCKDMSKDQLAAALPAHITACPYKSKPSGTAPSAASASSSASNANSSAEPPNKKQKLSELDKARFAGDYFQDEAKNVQFRWNMERPPPPAGYVCKICKVAGHWIQDCKEKKEGGKPATAGTVCHHCKQTGHKARDCPQPGGGEPLLPGGQHQQQHGDWCPLCKHRGHKAEKCPSKQDCWFCMSSPKLAAQLIVSVGNYVYLALDKGPMVPDHVLICPVTHIPSTVAMEPHDLQEVQRYKRALRDYCKKKGLVAFFIERNIPTRYVAHAIIQCIPVPEALVPADCAQWFADEALANGIDLLRLPAQADVTREAGGVPFLHIELPDQSHLLHLAHQKKKGLFNFGRQVMALMIKDAKKADWRECQLSEEQEGQYAERFKDGFEPFDFTLKEGYIKEE